MSGFIWILHYFIWIIFRPIMTLSGQVILGSERLQKASKPYIFISNHESHFDPFILSNAIAFWHFVMPIRFFTRDIFFTQFRLKYVLRMLGAFPGQIGKGIEIAATRPLAFLKRGHSVGIFPEWCFPDQPDLARMQQIGPSISRQSGRAIVPVYLYGIERLTWSKILSRKQVITVLGNPIAPEPQETLERYTERVAQGLSEAKQECFRWLRRHEDQFWKSYSEFYKYLELAEPYQEMKQLIHETLPVPTGEWLDVGTGSGAMADIILNKPGSSATVVATDFSEEMLRVAATRHRGNARITLSNLDLSGDIPYETMRFNGVMANLVLPYVAYRNTLAGRRALVSLLGELHRILKPGGTIIWSTPKRGVNFTFVALGSWRSFFDREHPEYRSYAFHILRHALRIQDWGRREIYNFLTPSEVEEVMHEAGFRNVSIETALVGQVYVICAQKVGSSARVKAPVRLRALSH